MKVLEERLDRIRSELVELHHLSKKAVELSIAAMYGGEDEELEVGRIEKQADVMNTDIENDSLSAVALFQPVAKDLRFLSTVMRLSGNYERITDLALKIAQSTVDSDFCRDKLEEMHATVLEMFDIVENALKGEVEGMKGELVSRDDRIDLLKREVLDQVEGRVLDRNMLGIIFAATHLERIGDILSKNGARIIFIEEGRRVWIK
ncbi:phosphate signaling complex PhoU family protein [Geoglobus sp.]